MKLQDGMSNGVIFWFVEWLYGYINDGILFTYVLFMKNILGKLIFMLIL